MRFRILGPLAVWTGREWSGISAPKLRALLAALLLNPGERVSTDRLIAELWGDDPPAGAPNVISVYVRRLRHAIGDHEGRVLLTRTPGYQLPLAEGDLDAAHFESLAGRGRRELAAGNAELAAAVLAQAVDLWRGRALADVPPSPLVSAEAARLEESRLNVLELRIEADMGLGQHGQLVPELRRLVSDEPLREGLWCLLMRALDGAGRYAEAVAAYGQAREAISDELGVDPGPGLRSLYQMLLAADRADVRPGLGGTAAAAPAPRPGAVPAPRAPAGIPGPGGVEAAAPPAPSQLPADVVDFTGRGEQVTQLCDLLAVGRGTGNRGVAVVVVAGAPGLGKSALAVHAAHALRPSFPDGQLYVSLLGASQQPLPADEALARFLRDLGVAGARIPVGQEERAALYRTRLTDRRMLIVLDDAADAAQVRLLLPGSDTCAVIVTSRQHLSDLAGSRLIDLDVLDDDDARTLFAKIIGDKRAAAEPGPTGAVLGACAGLPLAIRIAGARLTARRGWSVSTLADRLADQRHRMDELVTGDLAVRTCFQVSFDALPRADAGLGVSPAHVFRLLGVWQGPSIGIRAAAALAGLPEQPVADALEVLVDAHLLESPAPDRYRLHDLLHAYAAERAQADEPPRAVADAVHRMLSWYLRTADAVASVIAPHRDRVQLGPAEPGCQPLAFQTAEQALTWCELERANLVAAVRQAAASGLHDIAWKLPVAAMVGFDRHGYRAEWLASHRIALVSARTLGERQGEAWVLNNLGTVLSQQRTDDALGYFQQALAIHAGTGDLRGQARAANNLAYTYQLLGRHEDAVGPLLDALDLQRRVGHRYGEGVALCNLGEAYLELGRYDEAIVRSPGLLT